MNWNNFAKNFTRNYEKINAWNIKSLVDESFVPLTQSIILKIVGFKKRKKILTFSSGILFILQLLWAVIEYGYVTLNPRLK
jgi:hypothetical protein